MPGYPTRLRYGLRFLVRLASRRAGHVSIGDVAQEEGVSVKYLEQIVAQLKPLGILSSIRGARGGYTLSRDPAEIPLDQVFERLGGLEAPAPCLDDSSVCRRAEVCTTRPFWQDFDTYMRNYLSSLTLADLAASAPRNGVEFEPGFGASLVRDNVRNAGCASGR